MKAGVEAACLDIPGRGEELGGRDDLLSVDHDRQGGKSLMSPLAGRAYHLVAGAGARAAFHPKVLLLSGREGARLCVSSANLTPDGQLRNAESLIAFDWHLAGHQQPIRDAADFFRRLSDGAPAHTAAAIQHAISALQDADDEPSLSHGRCRGQPPRGVR